MAEVQAPFTPEQIADICRFLGIIQEVGGYGKIILEVVNGKMAFIRIGEVSKKYSESEVAGKNN